MTHRVLCGVTLRDRHPKPLRSNHKNNCQMDPIILTSKEELQALIRESYRALREGEEAVPTIITIDPQPLLTVDEAVEYLRISKNTLYGYTSKGCIPHIKQGKRVLFRKSQLDAWLDAKQRGTAQ